VEVHHAACMATSSSIYRIKLLLLSLLDRIISIDREPRAPAHPKQFRPAGCSSFSPGSVVGSCTYTFTYGQKDVRFTVHIYTCMMGIIGGRKGSVGYSRYILCLTACYILQWYYLHASWYYYKHKGHASRERMCSARGNFFIFFWVYFWDFFFFLPFFLNF
jgi:hypothetical protein